MNSEGQTSRLLQMMQKQAVVPSYELLLPFVAFPKKASRHLCVNDVLILGLKTFELKLLKEGKICARLSALKSDNIQELEVLELLEEPIKSFDSKKYDVLKLSFGFLQSNVLNKGSKLRVTQINFEKVSLILKDIKIAEATLILVDGKIALQIDKVE